MTKRMTSLRRWPVKSRSASARRAFVPIACRPQIARPRQRSKNGTPRHLGFRVSDVIALDCRSMLGFGPPAPNRIPGRSAFNRRALPPGNPLCGRAKPSALVGSSAFKGASAKTGTTYFVQGSRQMLSSTRRRTRWVSGSSSPKSDDLKYSAQSQRQDPCTGTELKVVVAGRDINRTRARRRTPLETPPFQVSKVVELFCRCGRGPTVKLAVAILIGPRVLVPKLHGDTVRRRAVANHHRRPFGHRIVPRMPRQVVIYPTARVCRIPTGWGTEKGLHRRIWGRRCSRLST